MISAEVIWDSGQCGGLAEDWASIDQIGLCEPSTSLAWARALAATHVQASDIAFVVSLRSAGRVVGLVPGIIRREYVAGTVAVNAMYPLCDLTTFHSDILRASDQPGLVTAFMEAVAALPGQWDVLRFGRLIESGPIARQFAEYLAGSRLAHRIRCEQPSFFLELGESYEQFLAGRSAKFRNHLRRKARQLAAAGRLQILRAGRDLDVEEAYRHLLSIEERSWKHAHGTAVSAVPHQREFYRLLCDGLADRGQLHMLLMFLDDTPIAYDLGIVVADRYSYLKTSFVEGMRRFSPATVLRARLVEALIAEGVRSLDFPAEPYLWEKQWTETQRWHASVLVFNRTPKALLYRFLVRAREVFRRAQDTRTVVYTDPRARMEV